MLIGSGAPIRSLCAAEVDRICRVQRANSAGKRPTQLGRCLRATAFPDESCCTESAVEISRWRHAE